MWRPSKYDGIKQIRVPINKIWKPDIVLYTKWVINCCRAQSGFRHDALSRNRLLQMRNWSHLFSLPIHTISWSQGIFWFISGATPLVFWFQCGWSVRVRVWRPSPGDQWRDGAVGSAGQTQELLLLPRPRTVRRSSRWEMAETKANIYLPQQELWKGNVFTPVCDSVHRGEGDVHLLGRHPPGRHPRYCSGRYASYFNAFLFWCPFENRQFASSLLYS